MNTDRMFDSISMSLAIRRDAARRRAVAIHPPA
jgi:hypothetical protein